MRKKIVAGNWKMNMNLQDGIALAKELNETLTAEKPNCGVVICTPFIHLASIAQFLNQEVIGLGAENCADKEKGAYTGEVSAEMVKSTGAQYVILGHSERREYYNETPEILKEKVLLALKNGLKVIFCIGESLAEREANKQNEVCKGQRYNRETLEVKYKGKTIYDILEMTVAEGVEFFANIPKIFNKLNTLNEAGKTIIIVTHDRNIAARCKRVIELADGEIVRDSKKGAAKLQQ